MEVIHPSFEKGWSILASAETQGSNDCRLKKLQL
jgi:hypothetical protein